MYYNIISLLIIIILIILIIIYITKIYNINYINENFSEYLKPGNNPNIIKTNIKTKSKEEELEILIKLKNIQDKKTKNIKTTTMSYDYDEEFDLTTYELEFLKEYDHLIKSPEYELYLRSQTYETSLFDIPEIVNILLPTSQKSQEKLPIKIDLFTYYENIIIFISNIENKLYISENNGNNWSQGQLLPIKDNNNYVVDGNNINKNILELGKYILKKTKLLTEDKIIELLKVQFKILTRSSFSRSSNVIRKDKFIEFNKYIAKQINIELTLVDEIYLVNNYMNGLDTIDEYNFIIYIKSIIEYASANTFIWEKIYLIDKYLIILMDKNNDIYTRSFYSSSSEWNKISSNKGNNIAYSKNYDYIYIATDKGILINDNKGNLIDNNYVNNIKFTELDNEHFKNKHINAIECNKNGNIIVASLKDDYIIVGKFIEDETDGNGKTLWNFYIISNNYMNYNSISITEPTDPISSKAKLILSNDKSLYVHNFNINNKNKLTDIKELEQIEDVNGNISKIVKYETYYFNGIIAIVDNISIYREYRNKYKKEKFNIGGVLIKDFLTNYDGTVAYILGNNNKLYVNKEFDKFFKKNKSKFEELVIDI